MPARLYKHDPTLALARSQHFKVAEIPTPLITASTKLVSIRQAAIEIASNKGWNISEETIRDNCRSGKWQKGFHWVKPGKQYLISLDSVYAWIARSGEI